jgi:hypothetical protein
MRDEPSAPSLVPVLIAAYMHASAARKPGGRTGPFTLGLDAHTDEPMRNYAVPDSGASPAAGDVATLIEAFRASQRVPRWSTSRTTRRGPGRRWRPRVLPWSGEPQS